MNPYETLGLNQGATDDEVKKAYRQLAKKYHPDANPGDKVAEQKMKDINAAYDMIINKKYQAQSNPFSPNGQSQAYYGSSRTGQGPQQPYTQYAEDDPFDFSSFGFGPFGAFFYGNQGGQSPYDASRMSGAGDTPALSRARERILSEDFTSALQILADVPLRDRNARWYYYSAIANEGAGNRIQARQDASKAIQIEPGNAEYQALYRQLNGQSQAYNQTSHAYRAPTFGVGGLCLTFLCLGAFCRTPFVPLFCCC